MIRSYITVAIRNLLRHKGYAAINILGLTIGLATCILIVRYVQDELAYDAWHTKSDRIYRVVREARTGDETDIRPQTSGALSEALMAFPEVEQAVRVWPWFTNVVKDDEKFEFEICAVDPAFFEVFDFPFARGDHRSAFPSPESIAITRSGAKKLFGDEDPIGKTVRVESNHHGGEKRVTSVLEDVPSSSTIEFEYVAAEVFSEEAREVWNSWRPTGGWRPVHTYILVREGADVGALEEKMQGLIQRHFPPEVAKTNQYHLQPLNRIYLYSKQDYGLDWYSDINRVYQFGAIAFLVLAIACINFTNLATARSAGRAKEVGLRKVSGAVRGQLMGQFLGESVVTAVLALLVAVVMVLLTIGEFNAFFEKQLDIDVLADPLLGVSLLVVTLGVGCAAGLYPALFLSAFEPTETLKGTFRAGNRGQAIRKGLVVLQFAISIVLVIGTGVIYQQMSFIRDKDLGFDIEQVVVVPLFWTDQESKGPDEVKLADRYETIKSAFLNHPNVLEASAYRWSLGWGGGIIRNVRAEGHENSDWRMPMFEVDDDYLDLMRIELVAGRKFDLERFPSDSSGVFILNESAVKALGYDNDENGPIGKRFEWVDREVQGTVIGVVKDFNYGPLTERIGPACLTVWSNQFYALATRVKAENFEDTVAHFKEMWGQFVDKSFPYEHVLWDQQFEMIYQAERRVQSLTLFGAGIAILLACMGLFGLASFAMAERTKEIGVRKSLGASVASVLVLVSREFLVMVVIAAAIATPVAWSLMEGWLSRFAYRTELGIGVFLLGTLLTMVIAQVTVTYHALRAARTDPVKSLRYE